MARASGDLIKLDDETELIKLSQDKYKYMNIKYEKVSAKMYDHKCDIKLTVDTQSFRAHRAVLSEASDYFSAMFRHDMKEKEQQTIALQEISPTGFGIMMDYFYHGHISVDPSNIEDVLEASRFFHIEWLIHISCDFLVRHLCLGNYSGVLDLADQYCLGDLRKSIFGYICHNFQSLYEQKKFDQLSPELLEELLSGGHYIEASESVILNTVLAWLHADMDDREECRTKFLNLIRFALLVPQDLDKIPENFIQSTEMKKKISDAKAYLEDPNSRCLQTSDMTEVRGSKTAIVLFSALDDCNLIQYKIPGQADFFSESITSDFLQSLFEFSCIAVLGNYMFVAGGYDRRKYWSSPALYCYNPRNREWAHLSSMERPRVSHALVASERGLYAIAGIEHSVNEGRDQEDILSEVEFYDPVENLWCPVPGLPYGCFSLAAACHDGKIFTSGGITDDPENNVPVNHLHMYDASGDKSWQVKAPMLIERQNHAMAACHNHLYVFGGYTAGEDTMNFAHCLRNESYDIETNQWSSLLDFPASANHIQASSAVLDGKVYLLGGSDEMRMLYQFDTESGLMTEGEMCGELVQKVAIMRIAYPWDQM